jgi:hypothetical protein
MDCLSTIHPSERATPDMEQHVLHGKRPRGSGSRRLMHAFEACLRQRPAEVTPALPFTAIA